MKHLTRIFLAVAILFASFACTTDTTEDLGVNGLGQTTITLSLEESRTQLGEKVGDLYPVYWSEGDQISVNGVASNALTAEQAGSSVAAFTVSGTHDTYNIAYPAAEANQVLFAATQAHTSNTTFASGAATLYGVGSAEQGVELHHLTGVLKIGVTGAGTLKKAHISTIDNTPIAGAFDIDFTNGEVTPSATAKTVVNYSFGEGVALSSEPTFIHVAVPAGVYNELYVTLFDNNDGVMYATVKADNNKPLTAGNVRSFSQHIEFAPINSVAHIISEAADLVEFAAVASTSTKDVIFVDDIDMSEVEWTPIEGYAGTINGNGYAIKGLKAPLFGSTSAKIKGLHLKGVDQEWTTLTHGGLFACDMNEGGMLSHCSAEGKIHINNTTYDKAVERQQYDLIYGGLVGLVTGATIEHCENNADITITSLCAESVSTSSSHLYGLSFGGIVGAAELLEGGNATSILHVRNNGDVLFANTKALGRGYHWVGGVFGQTINDNALSAFSHCYNYGDIKTINDSAIAAIRLGGVFGDLATNPIKTIDFIENHGDLYIHGVVTTSTPMVHGIGYTAYVTEGVNDCLNTGDITLQANAKANTYVCGGILGITCTGETKGVCHRMKNEGNITVLPYDASSAITSGTLTIVGLTNNMNCGLEGTEDNPSGNSGNIYLTSTSAKDINVAGVAITLGQGYTLKNVKNSGNITIDSTITDTGVLYASGICSTIKSESEVANVQNSGNIAISGSFAKDAYISGVANSIASALTDVANSGKLSTTATHKGPLQVAGIVATSFTGLDMLRVNNSGDLDIHSNIQKELRVAGFWPSNNKVANSVTFTNCHNSGYINIVGTTTTTTNYVCHVGGFMGYINKPATFDGCSNNGKVVDGVEKGIYVERNCTSGYNCTGGAVGWCYNTDITIRNGFTNSAKIHSKINNSYSKYDAALGYPVGGVIGIYHKAAATFDWEGVIKNTGDIIFEGKTTTTRLGVGGIVGISNATTTCKANLVNTGKIVLKEEATLPSTYGFGGIFGIASGKIENAKSYFVLDNDATNIGWITGSARVNDSVVAKNCQIGGGKLQIDSADESTKVEKFSESDFYNYIYGSGTNTDWTGTDNYDGCTLLSAMPE